LVRGVGVGVAELGGADAWVCADEDADEVWSEDVGEGGQVSVF
jgi:hypothetical protein